MSRIIFADEKLSLFIFFHAVTPSHGTSLRPWATMRGRHGAAMPWNAPALWTRISHSYGSCACSMSSGRSPSFRGCRDLEMISVSTPAAAVMAGLRRTTISDLSAWASRRKCGNGKKSFLSGSCLCVGFLPQLVFLLIPSCV